MLKRLCLLPVLLFAVGCPNDPAGDTTAPTVSLDAAPANVSAPGSTLTAIASDDVGVVKVEFFVARR